MRKTNLLLRTHLAKCVLVCLAFAGAVQADPQTGKAAERPNFSGTWRLNRELSDKPEEKLKESIGQKGGIRGRIISGRIGQGQMKEKAAIAEVLKIEHNDPEIQVTRDNNRSLRLFTDGRKVEVKTPRGESAETTARWQGSQLVVVGQGANGRTLTQTYTMDPGGQRIKVVMRIADQRLERPIEFRLVYDASE
jgi:hypothetical protein